MKGSRRFTKQPNTYLRIKGVSDSIGLQMLRRVDYPRERNILGVSHVFSFGTPSIFHIGREIEGADSLLSLALKTRWNPRNPLYVSTRSFCSFFFFSFFIYTFTHLKQNTISRYININVPGIQVKKAWTKNVSSWNCMLDNEILLGDLGKPFLTSKAYI